MCVQPEKVGFRLWKTQRILRIKVLIFIPIGYFLHLFNSEIPELSAQSIFFKGLLSLSGIKVIL